MTRAPLDAALSRAGEHGPGSVRLALPCRHSMALRAAVRLVLVALYPAERCQVIHGGHARSSIGKPSVPRLVQQRAQYGSPCMFTTGFGRLQQASPWTQPGLLVFIARSTRRHVNRQPEPRSALGRPRQRRRTGQAGTRAPDPSGAGRRRPAAPSSVRFSSCYRSSRRTPIQFGFCALSLPTGAGGALLFVG